MKNQVYVVESRPRTPEGAWHPVQTFLTKDAADTQADLWNKNEHYEYRVMPYTPVLAPSDPNMVQVDLGKLADTIYRNRPLANSDYVILNRWNVDVHMLAGHLLPGYNDGERKANFLRRAIHGAPKTPKDRIKEIRRLVSERIPASYSITRDDPASYAITRDDLNRLLDSLEQEIGR